MTQTQHRFARAVLVASVFIAFAAPAKAELVRCVDEAGSVSITDVPCRSGVKAVPARAVPKASTGGGKGSPQAKRFAAAERARAIASANKPANSRRLALDVATLKAARVAMLSNDETSAMKRQEALAAQADRPGVWEFWRT